jgi:hypothetical protein
VATTISRGKHRRHDPEVHSIQEVPGELGTIGMRGPNPGELDIVHHMAADSKGNLYTAEIVTNRRAQKFVIGVAR